MRNKNKNNAIQTPPLEGKGRKNLPILLHILAWIIIAIIPHFLIKTFGDGNEQFLFHLYVNLAIYGVLFYLHYFWLIPHFFFKNKKAVYFTIAALLVILSSSSLWYLNDKVLVDQEKEKQIEAIFEEYNKTNNEIRPPIKQFRIVDYLSTAILIWGFAFGLKVIEKVGKDEKEKKELEKEKLNSELAFLKNQISPHFFFNTLNNIYSLIEIDSKEAQQAVLQLSKMMRYLLYDSENRQLKLSDEIAFMSNYIDLMKLRLNGKVKLNINFPTQYTNLSIPPLLFISFVENAFKHGVSYRENSFIDIKMEVNENKISFVTFNSIGKSSNKNDGQYSGIGMENIKKRLKLLFPDSHKLEIDQTENDFKVSLSIEV